MWQNIIIGLAFTAATVYLIRMVRKQFTAKSTCAKGCGCSKIDLDKIEKEINSIKK